MSVPLLIPSRPYVKWAYFEVVYNEVRLIQSFRRWNIQRPKFS